MRLAALLPLVLPSAAAAHPHVFADAAVEVVTESGAVTAIRLTWTYDDLFSLVLVEDLGLDPDGDLALDPAEAATLQASVAAWPPDFAGDLLVQGPAGSATLAPRQEHRIAYEGGRVVETHLRPLTEPRRGPVTVKTFDPSYYVSYTVTEAAVSGDPACTGTLVRADLQAAQAEVDATWAGLDWASAAPDVVLPPIGEAFADRVEVSCAD